MPNRPAAPGGLALYAGASPLGVDRGTRASVRDAVRRFHEVRESAPTLERTSVREASVGGAKTTGAGRMLVRLIKAGVSLNGNAYPAQVLREAAMSRAWGKGCKAYIDHATPEEEEAHPSGSVKNLAGVLTEDARWDEATQSLVAEVRLFEPWRGPLTDMAESIGMSIRAWVTGEHGEFEGRESFVVGRIEAGRSCDFVTTPAAGGAIISVLEAVGNPVPVDESATLGGWLESRLHLCLTQYADDMYGDGQLTREERIALSGAIGDGLQSYVARLEQDAPQLYQRSRYEDPPEPVAVAADETTESATEAQPIEDVTDGAPPPAPETPPHIEEEPVSGIQTGAPPEQAGTAVPGNETPTTATEQVAPAQTVVQPSTEALAAIVAAAVREATGPLTAQIADLSARESARDAALRDGRNRQTAGEAVAAALRAPEHDEVRDSITARVTARVTGAVPTTAEGAVDDAALGELVTGVIADEATHVRRERANALAEAGVGLPYGMGATTTVESVEDDGLDGQLERFFSESLGLPEGAAKIAARGRG
jgi:hypothetical protein